MTNAWLKRFRLRKHQKANKESIEIPEGFTITILPPGYAEGAEPRQIIMPNRALERWYED